MAHIDMGMCEHIYIYIVYIKTLVTYVYMELYVVM